MRASVSMLPGTYPPRGRTLSCHLAVHHVSTRISTSHCRAATRIPFSEGTVIYSARPPGMDMSTVYSFFWVFFSAANRGASACLYICSCMRVRVYLRDRMSKENM